MMKANLKMILAMDHRGGIGYKNDLPWGNKYPQDLAYFKQQTLNDVVVFGRNTFLSLKRPEGLPKRTNIVITSQYVDCGENVLTMTLEEFLFWVDDNPDKTIWVCGGEALYKATFPYISELHCTHIPGDYQADTFMPTNFMLQREFETVKGFGLEGTDASVYVYPYQ